TLATASLSFSSKKRFCHRKAAVIPAPATAQQTTASSAIFVFLPTKARFGATFPIGSSSSVLNGSMRPHLDQNSVLWKRLDDPSSELFWVEYKKAPSVT